MKRLALGFALLFVFLPLLELHADCGVCGPAKASGKTVKKDSRVCTAACCSVKKGTWATSHKHKVGIVNTFALKTLLDSNVPLVLVDARSEEFQDGKRIPGAHFLNAESKLFEIKKLLPDKSKLVVTYCANLKCPASHALSEKLKSLGYTNLLEYPEGIQGWREAGLEAAPAK